MELYIICCFSPHSSLREFSQYSPLMVGSQFSEWRNSGFFSCCFMKADHVAFSQFDITYHGHIRLDTPFEPHGKIPHFGICRWLSNQKSTDLTTASTMGMICVYSTKNRDIAQACSKKVQTYSKQQEKSIKQQNLTRKSSIKDGGNIIKKEIEISHVMFKHS